MHDGPVLEGDFILPHQLSKARTVNDKAPIWLAPTQCTS